MPAAPPPASFGFTLPSLPPATNHLYLTVGRRRVLAPAARAWKANATLIIAVARGAWAVPPRTPLTVTLALTLPRLYGRDLDGALKLCLDSLAAAVGVDDRYIVALVATKTRGPEGLAGTVTVAA